MPEIEFSEQNKIFKNNKNKADHKNLVLNDMYPFYRTNPVKKVHINQKTN